MLASLCGPCGMPEGECDCAGKSIAPGADTGNAGGGGGPVQTSSAEAVDDDASVERLLLAAYGSNGPMTTHMFAKLLSAWNGTLRALEQERRETARLREQLALVSGERDLESGRRDLANIRVGCLKEELRHAKEAEAEALVQAGEAAERAWEYSMKLQALRPAVLMRELLLKNERTIRTLRAVVRRTQKMLHEARRATGGKDGLPGPWARLP